MIAQPSQHKRSKSGVPTRPRSGRGTIVTLDSLIKRNDSNGNLIKMKTLSGFNNHILKSSIVKNPFMFQKAPIRLEGDLSMTKSSPNHTARHKKSKSFNMNTPSSIKKIDTSHKRNLSRYETPSLTGKIDQTGSQRNNKSKSPNSARGFTNSKLKPSDSSLMSNRSNNNNSFTLPKKDIYNLRGLLSKTKNNIESSYYKLDALSRTGFSSKPDNRNLSARSATPNSSRSQKRSSRDTSSNLIQNKPNNIENRNNRNSKSPVIGLRKNDNNIFNTKSINTNKDIKSASITAVNKIKAPFDSSLIKHISEFKNNKSNVPVIYSSYAKKILNNKTMLHSGIKLRSNQNKTITGVIQNLNQTGHNTGDVSTNSTFPSKFDAKSGNSISETQDKIDKDSDNSTDIKSNNRMNLHKENLIKSNVDFRTITTSPLLRNKPTDPLKVNEHLDIGKGISKQNSLNKKVTIKKIKTTHQFSHVGFAGYGVKKVNQDSYFIFQNFVGNPNHIFFGVCDGHGINGHEVSGYLKQNLPISLHSKLRLKNKNILVHNVKNIIEDTFSELNFKLHTSEYIDTTFSGSTCVSLIYTPEKILCANVGDSRAVIGRCINEVWTSHDLSRDHKPSEKDEAQRVLSRGGRIQPFRDEDNEFIGPPRVWLREEEIPGLAMTRAFGDRVASTVGVIAEPEIKEYKFEEEDKFLIIASDGVWEFIESDECVNIVKEYYLRNDIVGCCEYIYKESSTRWMREEEVIDDITMIIVFFD